MNNKYCIGTLNVAGFRCDPIKVQKTFDLVKNTTCICLQETYFRSKIDCRDFDRIFGGDFRIYHSVVDANRQGVSLLFNYRHLGSNYRKVLEIAGRAIGISYKMNDINFLVIGIYAPANAKNRPVFYEQLLEKLCEIPHYSDVILLLGDFNLVEDPAVDRSFQPIVPVTADRGLMHLKPIIDLLAIRDIYRFLSPSGRDYSFFSKSHLTQSRLDRIYANQAVIDCTASFEFEVSGFTDHKFVSAEFSLAPFVEPRGNSYWKLNVTLLKDEDVQEEIVSILRDSDLLRKRGFAFLQGWDTLKFSIQQVFRKWAVKKKRQNRLQNQKLQRDLKYYQAQVKTDPANVHIREGLDFTLGLLRNTELDKVKSALNQTHYKDICVDTCFLHTAKKLQKKSAEGRHFYGLRTEEGTTVWRSFEIVKEIRKQMGDLFTSRGCKKEDMIPFLGDLPKLSEEQQEQLNFEINGEEIILALNSMGRGKTPGSDGLPMEFYLAYQALITPFLVRLVKECLSMGYMSKSMHYGIITLLYKGKGLRSERGNWRPLTMLNVDYKALTKVLTKRVGFFMSYLVHPNQTCAVPGRDIRDSLLSLYNTVQTVIDNEDEGILLSLDHQSAFDIIEWDFVFEALKGFNFGEKFISSIKMIYNASKVHSSVQVNNFVSASFSVTRGIRQGCPLSPTLYVLVAETVANYIRRDNLVWGVQIF